MSFSSAGARRSLRLALLVIAQIIVALIVVEILGEMYFNNPNSVGERFLFTSPDSFRDIGKFWTYSPNRTIREVAIYQKALGGFEQEYDCLYPTDRLGFVDNRNSDRKDFDFLLLGDSFTQGQGGCPWASRLRHEVPGVSIYNAGLQGTGPGNWAPEAQYLLDNGLRFRNEIFIFISDDFRRVLFNYGQALFSCLHDISLCHGQFFYPITPGADLMKISAERARGTMSLYDRVLYFWQEHLWVTEFLAAQIKDRMFGAPQPDPISDDARTGLAWLRSHFPHLRFIRIRTKDEVAFGADDAPTLAVRRYLHKQHITWTDCDIGYDGFLHRDPHPNTVGYSRLAKCVAKVILDTREVRSVGSQTINRRLAPGSKQPGKGS